MTEEPKNSTDPETALEELHNEMRSCTKCGLRATCLNVVPGEGWAKSLVLFMGEGPGENEDQEGRPFVGRSGDLLRDQLRQNGFDTERVYIGNAVRCRPPDNRVPTPEETEACWPWMAKTLSIVKPRIIVPLGRTALVLLAQKLGFFKRVGQNPITKLAGVPFFLDEKDVYIYPVFHPSYALRQNRSRAEFCSHIKYLKLAVPGWTARP